MRCVSFIGSHESDRRDLKLILRWAMFFWGCANDCVAWTLLEPTKVMDASFFTEYCVERYFLGFVDKWCVAWTLLDPTKVIDVTLYWYCVERYSFGVVQTIIALLRKLFMHDIGADKSDTVSFLLLSPRSIMTKIRNTTVLKDQNLLHIFLALWTTSTQVSR
jgi:hypothetical protein